MQIMHRKASAILNLEAWFSSENLRRLHQGKSLRSHGFSLLYSKRTNQVCIRDLKIECGARPLTLRGEEDGFHLEIESSEPLDEKTELYAVDPLCSRGINKFLRESSCQLHEDQP